jgi:predicted phosphodiesterase
MGKNYMNVKAEQIDEYFEHNYDALKQMIEGGTGRCRIADEFGVSSYMATKWISMIRKDLELQAADLEAERLTGNLMRQSQKLMDSNRILRKNTRGTARLTNAIEEYENKLIEIFSASNLSNLTTIHETKDGVPFGILQISDAHFNELVNLPNNQFDFSVGSARLRKLVERARVVFHASGVDDVLVAMTGDLMNSDRRLDELLSEATNRSKATFVAVDILQQMILDLNQDFNVFVAHVTGNESRITKEVGWSAEVASDNYDTTIFNILKYLFKASEGVIFIDGDPVEVVINLNGTNVLLLHGNGSIKANVEESVSKVIGRYAAQNVVIDYVLFGHKHSAYIGDKFARSSSLVGANSYSEFCINACSRASQNIYLVHSDASVDAMKIDLQNTYEEGYDISESLIDSAARSVTQNKNPRIIKAIR